MNVPHNEVKPMTTVLNAKFEFTGETKVHLGITLHRIRAVAAIEALEVAAGDLGGWVEKENNLSVSGDAWVFGNACVFGDARVSGNAWVSGNACVSGNARVSDNARVSGNAWVSGNACVYGDACVSGNAQVYGNAQVFGNACVFGDACVSGNAWVSGDACVYGDGDIQSNNDWFSFSYNEKTLTGYRSRNEIGYELNITGSNVNINDLADYEPGLDVFVCSFINKFTPFENKEKTELQSV